jgi:hypothetical protein
MMKTARRAIRMEWLSAVVPILALAACGGGDGAGNMMAAPGNALSESQIERALGPETAAASTANQGAAEDSETTSRTAAAPSANRPASRDEDRDTAPADPQPTADEPAGEEQE